MPRAKPLDILGSPQRKPTKLCPRIARRKLSRTRKTTEETNSHGVDVDHTVSEKRPAVTKTYLRKSRAQSIRPCDSLEGKGNEGGAQPEFPPQKRVPSVRLERIAVNEDPNAFTSVGSSRSEVGPAMGKTLDREKSESAILPKNCNRKKKSARSEVRFVVGRKGRRSNPMGGKRRGQEAKETVTPILRLKGRLSGGTKTKRRFSKLHNASTLATAGSSASYHSSVLKEGTGTSTSAVGEEIPPGIDIEQFDWEIEQKSTKANINNRNVKDIIKSIISNEQVLAMVQYKESCETDPDTAQLPPSLEPKMTRSRTRQLLADSQVPQLPLTPVKRPPSSTEQLITEEFPEDDDDEEYTPRKLQDVSEAATSPSPSSPTPSSPCSMSVCSMPHTPATPGSAFEEPLSQRTRSRKPLTDQALEELEKLLVAPDVTPDMYDAPVDDDDWANFLRDFNVPVTTDAQEDDEDEEYVFQQNDDVVEREEMRKDRAVQISQKEVDSLMSELFKDVGELQLTPPPPAAQPEPSAPQVPEEPPPPQPLSAMTAQHARQLEHQMIAHVQLLAQAHLLCCSMEELQPVRAGCSALLVELRSLASAMHKDDPSRSFFFPPNLEPALKVVAKVDSKSQEELYAEPCEIVYVATRKYVRLSDLAVKNMLCSTAFVFPDLLPLHSPRPPDFTDLVWTSPPVDQLIAMGLEMFTEYLGPVGDEIRKRHKKAGLIAKYMLPTTKQRIRERIHTVRRSWRKNKTDVTNPIMYYLHKDRAPPVPVVDTLPDFPLKPLRKRIKELEEPWYTLALRGNFFFEPCRRTVLQRVMQVSLLRNSRYRLPREVPKPCAKCAGTDYEQRFVDRRWKLDGDSDEEMESLTKVHPRLRPITTCSFSGIRKQTRDVLAMCLPSNLGPTPVSSLTRQVDTDPIPDEWEPDDPGWAEEQSPYDVSSKRDSMEASGAESQSEVGAARTRSVQAARDAVIRSAAVGKKPTAAAKGKRTKKRPKTDVPTAADAESKPPIITAEDNNGIAVIDATGSSSSTEGSVIELKQEDGQLVVYVRNQNGPTLRAPVCPLSTSTRLVLPSSLGLQDMVADRAPNNAAKRTGVVTPIVRRKSLPPSSPSSSSSPSSPRSPSSSPEPPSESSSTLREPIKAPALKPSESRLLNQMVFQKQCLAPRITWCLRWDERRLFKQLAVLKQRRVPRSSSCPESNERRLLRAMEFRRQCGKPRNTTCQDSDKICLLKEIALQKQRYVPRNTALPPSTWARRRVSKAKPLKKSLGDSATSIGSPSSDKPPSTSGRVARIASRTTSEGNSATSVRSFLATLPPTTWKRGEERVVKIKSLAMPLGDSTMNVGWRYPKSSTAALTCGAARSANVAVAVRNEPVAPVSDRADDFVTDWSSSDDADVEDFSDSDDASSIADMAAPATNETENSLSSPNWPLRTGASSSGDLAASNSGAAASSGGAAAADSGAAASGSDLASSAAAATGGAADRGACDAAVRDSADMADVASTAAAPPPAPAASVVGGGPSSSNWRAQSAELAESNLPSMVPPSLLTPLRPSSPPRDPGLVLGFPTPSLTPAPACSGCDPVTPTPAVLETPQVQSPPAHALLETPQVPRSPSRSPRTPPSDPPPDSVPPKPPPADVASDVRSTKGSSAERTYVRAAMATDEDDRLAHHRASERSQDGAPEAIETSQNEDRAADQQASTADQSAPSQQRPPLPSPAAKSASAAETSTDQRPGAVVPRPPVASAAAGEDSTATGGRPSAPPPAQSAPGAAESPAQTVRTPGEAATDAPPQPAAAPGPAQGTPAVPETKPAVAAEAADETAAQTGEQRNPSSSACLPAGRSSRPKRSRQQREAEVTRSEPPDVRQRREHAVAQGVRGIEVLRPARVISCSDPEEPAAAAPGPSPSGGSPPAKRPRRKTGPRAERGRRPRPPAAAVGASPPPPEPQPPPPPEPQPPPPPEPQPPPASPAREAGRSPAPASDREPEPEPEPWSRADDLEILTSCQRSGDGERTFRAIQRRLPSRSVEQLRGRFQQLMELLRQQMQQQQPEELSEDE